MTGKWLADRLPSAGGPSIIGWLWPNLARRSKRSLPDAAQDLPLVVSWLRLQSSWSADSAGPQTHLAGWASRRQVIVHPPPHPPPSSPSPSSVLVVLECGG